MTDFASLGLSPDLLRALDQMGFEEPTPIQTQAIPLLLEGRDVVAQALTGTGKTAAFGIPIVQSIDVERAVPQAVILAPTRELAMQVAEALSQIGRPRRVRLLPIYGGQPIDRQLRALREGVHIIVATPGRLMDHMRRGSVDLSQVRVLVLDEADQMLQMGFQEDVEYVMAHLQGDRATALFSATMPQPILDIVGRSMREPVMVQLTRNQELTAPAIEQSYFEVPYPRKVEALTRVLDVVQPDRALVFCATKRTVDMVVEQLQLRGYSSEGLHGDHNQATREKVLAAFRAGRSEVLIATDVAARGLDVPEVSLVVNFDIPPDPEYYVHRIGRTGRQGRSGTAITFVNPREMRELKVIERVTGARIARRNVPTIAEAEEAETQLMVERVLDAVAAGKGARFRGAMESLLNDYDGAELAAAALSLSVPERGGTASRDRADFLPSRERPAGRPHPKRHDQETGLGRSTYLKPMPYTGGPRRGRKNRPRD